MSGEIPRSETFDYFSTGLRCETIRMQFKIMVSCNDMPAIQISEILRFWRTWVTGAAIVLSVIPRGKISSCFVKQIWIFVTVHCLFWLQVKFVAILLSVCHITHGECRKCHGCWKSEWYTLFHHKDIDPFVNYIKKKKKNCVCKLDLSSSSFQWSPLHC